MTETLSLETLQEELALSEAALFALRRGKSAVVVHFQTDADSQRVEYQPAEVSALQEQISELKNRIAALQQGRPARGPLYHVF